MKKIVFYISRFIFRFLDRIGRFCYRESDKIWNWFIEKYNSFPDQNDKYIV